MTGGTAGDGRPGRDDVAAEPGPEQAASELGIPARVLAVATELEGFPRHLGIHPGGMVICDRPVSEVCPVEWARMENRTVLQWDKDDCAAVGLVKFDLLGLGMLEAIHRAVDTVGAYHHDEIDLAMIPQEEAVYDMLCRGDSVGLFQVESRAQMATLPRLRPRCFYDLVVEVALIRPGPIQGGSVHPYLRRRNGTEPVTYLHPCFERSLAKTLGVPLFQEQLMQMAIDAAGFSAAEADQLRQAMGSKRSASRMERLRARLYGGMAERGITGEVADTIWDQLAAFANFGFPESHSVSFAYLVYVSAWLKLHYPAAFLAALLNSQPMGFWAPHTLVADARRHGVVVLGPDVNKSEAGASLEPAPAAPRRPRSSRQRPPAQRPPAPSRRPARTARARLGEGCRRRPRQGDRGRAAVCGHGGSRAPQWRRPSRARSARHLGGARRARRHRRSRSPARSRRGRPLTRREALWAAGAAAEARPDRLPGTVVGTKAPPLPEMDEIEEMSADLQTLGLSPGSSPMAFAREKLASRGVVPNAELVRVPDGAKVLVAGVVTHRQRPATAGGTTFLNLEDETGLVNVICSPGAGPATARRLARPWCCSCAGGSSGERGPTRRRRRRRTSWPSTWRRSTSRWRSAPRGTSTDEALTARGAQPAVSRSCRGRGRWPQVSGRLTAGLVMLSLVSAACGSPASAPRPTSTSPFEHHGAEPTPELGRSRHLVHDDHRGPKTRRQAVAPAGTATVRERRDEWIAAGVFETIANEAISGYDRIIGLDLSDVALDAGLHKSPCGGGGTGKNPTDRAKLGWKWSVLTDKVGIPFGWTADGANRNDSVLLAPTLEDAERRGLTEEIETIWLDRGYDSAATRVRLSEARIDDAVIAKKRKTRQPRQGDEEAPDGSALAGRADELLALELRPVEAEH